MRSAPARAPCTARGQTAGARWPARWWSCRCREGRRRAGGQLRGGGVGVAAGGAQHERDGAESCRRPNQQAQHTPDWCRNNRCRRHRRHRRQRAHVAGRQGVLQRLHHLLLMGHLSYAPWAAAGARRTPEIRWQKSKHKRTQTAARTTKLTISQPRADGPWCQRLLCGWSDQSNWGSGLLRCAADGCV